MIVEIENGRILKPFAKVAITGRFELTPEKKKRTNAQNKLLHGVLFLEASKAISKKTGRTITPEFAKSLLKTKFAVEYDEELGEYIIPTSKMKTARCCKFIEDSVKYIAVFCNHYIELPGDWQSQISEEE